MLVAHQILWHKCYTLFNERRREVLQMPNYIINKVKTDGHYNEVHTTECRCQPLPWNQDILGWHADEIDAVEYAKRNGYPHADGCYYCCERAHRG